MLHLIGRFQALCLTVCVFLTGQTVPAQATTLIYRSDSAVEFDLFRQWRLRDNRATPIIEPSRAAWAEFHLSFAEPLAADSAYSLARYTGTGISDFSLTLVTDRGTFAVRQDFYHGLRLHFTTNQFGRISTWGFDWRQGMPTSDDDHFYMTGAQGQDEVRWTWIYMVRPDDPWENAAHGGGTFLGGQLFEDQTLQVISSPLPAPVVMLLSAFALLAGLTRGGRARRKTSL